MNENILAIGLMIFGAVLFLFGRMTSKRSSVHASGGSVAVGGDNSGSITNVNTTSQKEHGSTGHRITILAIIVEIIGIAVMIWHVKHMAGQ
jgi:hypothetical protein